MPGGGLELLHPQRLLRRQPGAPDQVRHADDGVERRTDLVAHVGQEGALGHVGTFGLAGGFDQLGGARLDHRLELLAVGVECRLRLLALGDVEIDAQQPHRLAGAVELGLALRQQPARFIRADADTELHLQQIALGDRLHHPRIDRGQILFEHPGAPCLVGKHPLGGQTEESRRFGREVNLAGLQVPVPHAHVGALLGPAQALLAVVERLLDLRSIGNVGPHPNRCNRLARLVGNERGPEIEQPLGAVRPRADHPATPSTRSSCLLDNPGVRRRRLRLVVEGRDGPPEKGLTALRPVHRGGPVHVSHPPFEVGDHDLVLNLIQHQRLKAQPALDPPAAAVLDSQRDGQGQQGQHDGRRADDGVPVFAPQRARAVQEHGVRREFRRVGPPALQL